MRNTVWAMVAVLFGLACYAQGSNKRKTFILYGVELEGNCIIDLTKADDDTDSVMDYDDFYTDTSATSCRISPNNRGPEVSLKYKKPE